MRRGPQESLHCTDGAPSPLLWCPSFGPPMKTGNFTVLMKCQPIPYRNLCHSWFIFFLCSTAQTTLHIRIRPSLFHHYHWDASLSHLRTASHHSNGMPLSLGSSPAVFASLSFHWQPDFVHLWRVCAVAVANWWDGSWAKQFSCAIFAQTMQKHLTELTDLCNTVQTTIQICSRPSLSKYISILVSQLSERRDVAR